MTNTRPNIILLVADDLGWSDVSYLGSQIETPAIDKIGKDGAILNQFYVMPACTPTRASLMTGRYPIRYGLQIGVIKPWNFYGLPTDEKINELSKRFTAFMAIMYDWLADKGKEPVTSLTEEHFYLNQLPHLTVEQYKRIMGQLDITDEKELLKIVNGLQKYGFLQLADGNLIKFRRTVSRFVTMFTAVAEREELRGEDGESDN